jgi:phage recombination protein Bet
MTALVPARLAMPAQARIEALTPQDWSVLVDAIYPNARSAESVMLAVRYCKSRNLDPFKRPVHIVPMWSSSAGRMVETVWPGINELQVTAHRTGQFAGMDAPAWGPEITRTFTGRVKDGNGYKDAEVTLTFPEWCAVTVYRVMPGGRMPFTEPVYWFEAYARQGKTELPNEMWAKRVRGQLQKCAKAAALRAAFPEELGNEYAAEEMEGREWNGAEDGGLVRAKEDAIAEGRAHRVVAATVTGKDKLLATKDAAYSTLADALERATSRAEFEALIDQNEALADVSRIQDGAAPELLRLKEVIETGRATLLDDEPAPYDADTGEVLETGTFGAEAFAKERAAAIAAAKTLAELDEAMKGEGWAALPEKWRNELYARAAGKRANLEVKEAKE